jgi:hypothetical protein
MMPNRVTHASMIAGRSVAHDLPPFFAPGIRRSYPVMWAHPPGGGRNRALCTRERAAASRSLSPEERVIANALTAPEAPMVKATPTTPFAPRARAAFG